MKKNLQQGNQPAFLNTRLTRSSSASVGRTRVTADQVPQQQRARSTNNMSEPNKPPSMAESSKTNSLSGSSVLKEKIQPNARLADLTALTDVQLQKTEAISTSPMRTRTKHLVALLPPQRFREEKAAEKSETLMIKAIQVKDDLFRRPKGRPSKAKNDQPIQSKFDKKRTWPEVQMSKVELRNDGNLQIGGVIQQGLQYFSTQNNFGDMKNADHPTFQPVQFSLQMMANPAISEASPIQAEDQIMEEEQELKQLVKNVAKKLTYDDEDIKSSNSNQSEEGGAVKRVNSGFKIMISDNESITSSEEPRDLQSSLSDRENPEEEDLNQNTLNKQMLRPIRQGREMFQNQHYGANSELQRAKLQEKLRNLNLSSSTILKRQQENPNLYKVGPTKYQDGSTKGHWTQMEDLILTDAVARNNQKNWKKIAEDLPGRTDVQCLHRWQKVLNPCLVKGPWTEEEDRMVLLLVQEKGAQKWTQIASHLDGRIGKQCRERWHNHLNPMIKKNPWSKEEEWILYICHRQYGNSWADIAQVLEGRTDNTIKNHWNSSMRKKLSDFKKEFEIQARKHLSTVCNEEFKGCGIEQMRTFSQSYRSCIKQVEDRILLKSQEAAHQQNKIYYEMKARELLEKREDEISFAMAKMLLKNLNLKISDVIPSPLKGQQKHNLQLNNTIRRQNQINTTAPNTVASFRQKSTTDQKKSDDIFNQLSKSNKSSVRQQMQDSNIVIQPFSIPEDQMKKSKADASINRKSSQIYPGKENANDFRKVNYKSQTSTEEAVAQNTFQQKKRRKQTDSRASSQEAAISKSTNQPAPSIQVRIPDTPSFIQQQSIEQKQVQQASMAPKHQKYIRETGMQMNNLQHRIPHENNQPQLLHLTLAEKGPIDKAYLVGNFFDYGQTLIDEEYEQDLAAQHYYAQQYQPPHLTCNLSFGGEPYRGYTLIPTAQNQYNSFYNNKPFPKGQLMDTPPNSDARLADQIGFSLSSQKQERYNQSIQKYLNNGNSTMAIRPSFTAVAPFTLNSSQTNSGNKISQQFPLMKQSPQTYSNFMKVQQPLNSPDQALNQLVNSRQHLQQPRPFIRQTPPGFESSFYNKQSPFTSVRTQNFQNPLQSSPNNGAQFQMRPTFNQRSHPVSNARVAHVQHVQTNPVLGMRAANAAVPNTTFVSQGSNQKLQNLIAHSLNNEPLALQTPHRIDVFDQVLRPSSQSICKFLISGGSRKSERQLK